MDPRARSPRGGYTLIELLITLVICGILIGALFEALLGQGRMARYIGAREEVQQNSRVAVEMIGSELRAAIPGGIVRAEPNALRLHAARAWGILCTTVSGGTGAQSAWVRFPAGTLPNTGITASPRRYGIAVAQTPNPSTFAGVGHWSIVAGIGTAATTNNCGTTLGAAANVEEVGFSGTNLVAAPVTQLLPGTLVVVYEDVLYDTGVDPSVGTTWVRRSMGFSALGQPELHPMAGPIPTTAGLAFRYFNALGDELLPAALLTQAGRNEIASVRVAVTANSTARTGNQQAQVDSTATRITLRNR